MSIASHTYFEVDVFASGPLTGNPLAVVFDADDLTDAQMQAFARWTNLSETTFVLKPTDAAADYRVRIFTPGGELPFAGHPTLGTCHAWLQQGGAPRSQGVVVQQCAKGLIRVHRTGTRLAFEAPSMQILTIDDLTLDVLCAALGLHRSEVMAHALLDNGPQWAALLIESAERVLQLKPDFVRLKQLLKVGVIGAHAAGSECAFELRGFASPSGIDEDPVTGSLNASVAQWLMALGHAPAHYIAAQGAALGREGRVYLDRADDGSVHVGGECVTVVRGQVAL
jgi:PhzF family phenazine biosynthesis protein